MKSYQLQQESGQAARGSTGRASSRFDTELHTRMIMALCTSHFVTKYLGNVRLKINSAGYVHADSNTHHKEIMKE